MPSYRRDRINEQMAKELCEILREVKDPRITANFVTITAADVTADLKFAKIYFSVLAGKKEAETEKEVQTGLVNAQGFIRTQLARRLNLRITPELSFHCDHSMQIGAHISKILGQIEPDEPPSGTNQNDPDAQGKEKPCQTP